MESIINYKFLKTIGEGSFGCVKCIFAVCNFAKQNLVGIHLKTQTNVAIKIIDREKLGKSNVVKFLKIFEIIKNYEHPHVLRFYEIFHLGNKLYVVMEYISGGDLFDYLCNNGKYTEDEGRKIFQQLISAISFMHSQGLAHRDLKPENLLMEFGKSLKIADFGLSKNMPDGYFLHTPCGSPNYAPPELILNQYFFSENIKRPYCGNEIDVWSCGVILFAILTGSLPFDDPNIPALYARIKNAIYTFPKNLSEEVKDLIEKMLEKEPHKRIKVPEILKHPWVSKDFPYYLKQYNEEPNIEKNVKMFKHEEKINKMLDNLSKSWVASIEEDQQKLVCKRLLSDELEKRSKLINSEKCIFFNVLQNSYKSDNFFNKN